MKTIIKRYTIIISMLIISGIIVYSFNNAPPHQFKEGQCGFCHINYEYPLRFRDNVTTLCNYCHGKRNVLSHTVGIKPSMQVAADFHLDEKGEMTCATCHSIHMDASDPATGERTYLLRSNLRGREFCDACHINTLEVVNADYTPKHADTMETAHFGYYTGMLYSIDRVSLYCMECHEGAIATHASVTMKTGTPVGESHPIGMDYMKRYRKSKDLRSPRDITKDVKFFEGKVGCTSCHNPFNLEKHRLVMTNEESRLCFECHLM